MSTNKEIFLKWLKGKNLPQSELDHTQAKSNRLKFKNHAENADIKDFISTDKLDSSFKTVLESSY